MGVDLLVAIGADALNRVLGEAGFGHKLFNAPLSPEALVLNVAAVVRQHLDFDGRLGGPWHFKRAGQATLCLHGKALEQDW